MMNNKQYFPWLMWFFPLSFFAFQFILRLFPGLVMTELLEKYHISATNFGIFASLYYLGYAGMQIPIAMLLDKYGPRRIIGLSALLCGFAVWLMLLCDSWWVALLSRFLIGVGSVVGFLGTSKVITMWFVKEKYARLIGLTFSIGLLGALYGGRPLSILIEQMGWEALFGALGCIALFLGFLNFSFVRNKNQVLLNNNCLKEDLKKLLTYPPLLILAFANFLMVGALEGFADVWGIPYLMAARQITKSQAAGITSFIFIGMLFGGPILAYFSEKFKAHYKIVSLCGIFMALFMVLILFFNTYLSSTLLMMVMFIIGILCCYQVIIFAIGADIVPQHLLGFAVAFLNCINMLGGSFFHSTIGRLMDVFEQVTLTDGILSYSIETYTFTLMLIPMASLVGAFLVWLSKQKNKQSSRIPTPSSIS